MRYGLSDDGDGVLWRSKVEPTSFKIYVADPVTGQAALQARLMIQGRNALVAVRLKVRSPLSPMIVSATRTATKPSTIRRPVAA
jgi:hypothetical protein